VVPTKGFQPREDDDVSSALLIFLVGLSGIIVLMGAVFYAAIKYGSPDDDYMQ
jgi:hypothetical protein